MTHYDNSYKDEDRDSEYLGHAYKRSKALSVLQMEVSRSIGEPVHISNIALAFEHDCHSNSLPEDRRLKISKVRHYLRSSRYSSLADAVARTADSTYENHGLPRHD